MQLPANLVDRVSNARRYLAIQVAMSEYKPEYRQLINMRLEEATDDQAIKFARKELVPFLKAIKFYELQYMAQPEVLKDIDSRLRQISTMKLSKEQADLLDPPDEKQEDVNAPLKGMMSGLRYKKMETLRSAAN